MNENLEKQQNGQGTEERSGFEADLKRLEAIVDQLEKGNLSLDESLNLYEDGIEAYKNCRKLLEEAETRVVKLVENLQGELEEQEMDGAQKQNLEE